MRTEVLELKRACFCFPLRYSLLLWGYVRLIFVASNICAKIIQLIDFESLKEGSIIRNIYWQVITWTLNLLDFTLVLIFITGAHKKSVKLLKAFYFYDIGLVILQTLVSVGCILYVVYVVFILNGIKMYKTFHVKRMLSLAAYMTTNLVLSGYVLLLVRSEIVKLNKNCQFRFVNNAAESECKMKYKITGDEEQGLEINYDETVESKDDCPENKGKRDDKAKCNMKYKNFDGKDTETEIISGEELCEFNFVKEY